MKINYPITIILILVSLQCFAQYDGNELSAARKCRDKGLYVEAFKHYKIYLDQSPTSNEVNTELAEMLFFEKLDYEQAYPYVKKVLNYERDTIVYYYALAKMEHYRGNYELASTMFNALVKNVSEIKDAKWVVDDSKKSLQAIDYYNTNKSKSINPSLKIVNLGDHVNSEYAEYVPVVDEKENFIMFTSRRKNEFNKGLDYVDDKFHEDMYMSKRTGHIFDTAVALPYLYSEVTQVENTKAHESLVSLSPDGKTLFIFKEGTLWKSEYAGGKWAAPVKLDKQVISKDYANHVTMTADGNTIYFTAERKSGTGKLDIYKASKNTDGTWSTADNIGSTINTAGNEQSPFISGDGKTLYFSSDAIAGYGGYDIFKSNFDGKTWSSPENLGIPYNSPGDDLFFYPKQDNSEGFYSSNRLGGSGDFDIYRFYFIDIPDFNKQDLTLANNVENVNNMDISTGAWIDKLAASTETAKLHFRVNDTEILSDAGKVKEMINSGMVKKLEVEQVKKCDTCVYKLATYYTVGKPTTEEMIAANISANNANNTNSNSNINSSTTSERTFVIYFDFNKNTITSESEKELQKAISYLNDNEKYVANLTGYADPKGNENYNKKLSAKRAKAAASFLKSNKLNKKRIKTIEGVGIIRPAVKCSDAACEEAENAKCRKVEIKIGVE